MQTYDDSFSKLTLWLSYIEKLCSIPFPSALSGFTTHALSLYHRAIKVYIIECRVQLHTSWKKHLFEWRESTKYDESCICGWERVFKFLKMALHRLAQRNNYALYLNIANHSNWGIISVEPIFACMRYTVWLTMLVFWAAHQCMVIYIVRETVQD